MPYEESTMLAGESVDTQEGKFLTFQLDREEYAIPIRHVIEIIGLQRITPLPELPDFVKGVINLRGKVIPVIDVRLRFGMPERAYDERTCIVVVDIDESFVGLIVDEVNEVTAIPAGQIEAPPTVQKGREMRFVAGLGKVEDSVKILVDINRLIFEEELNRIEETMQENQE